MKNRLPLSAVFMLQKVNAHIFYPEKDPLQLVHPVSATGRCKKNENRSDHTAERKIKIQIHLSFKTEWIQKTSTKSSGIKLSESDNSGGKNRRTTLLRMR
jgi:hypothetical protein